MLVAKTVRHFSTSITASKKYYDFISNQKYWQDKWKQELNTSEQQSFALQEDTDEKSYILSMFPYPSGSLHMGHVRVYTISDCIARFKRMCGKKVLHPIGWDSFGLPAENAAIERGIDPKEWTNQNIALMKQQLLSLGLRFEWSQELSTCDPQYYKWTQWLFLQLYKHGLVYRKKSLVNWDPVDCTVLANEQVDVNGYAWRSGAKVEKRFLDQWFIKTTDYSERLLNGLKDLDWPANVKNAQRSWIGKSTGSYFNFKIKDSNKSIKVFTTRPDTIFGVTFIALSPEHPLLQELELSDDMKQHIESIINEQATVSTNYSERDKIGVDLSISVTHPFTGEYIPVYVTNYVLRDYGSQAIMGVPGHDKRDQLFAESAGLKSIKILSEDGTVLINSEEFTGMSVTEAKQKIMEKAKLTDTGGDMTQYKLRDWLISRQRHWGTPIPVIHCDKCGIVPIPEDKLPVLLPEVTDGNNAGMRHNSNEDWIKVDCGKEGCMGVRESDTMDTFVDSSWYFMRYPDAHNDRALVSPMIANQWLPVDLYIGGIEHANLHLLYARFISYFLYDIGMLNDCEPFRKLIAQGMVQGRTHYLKKTGQYLRNDELDEYSPDELEVKWEKMSKSKHNGVNPNTCIEEHGADVTRVFTLFKAPPEMDIQWDTDAIKGVKLWLIRVWKLVNEHNERSTTNREVNSTDISKLVSVREKAIEQVTKVMNESYRLNTAVAELMKLSNSLQSLSSSLSGTVEYHDTLLVLSKLISPFAPHFSEQMWQELREASNNLNIPQDNNNVERQRWPTISRKTEIDLPILVNGKRFKTIAIPCDASIEKRSELALEACRHELQNDNVAQVICPPTGAVVNILLNK